MPMRISGLKSPNAYAGSTNCFLTSLRRCLYAYSTTPTPSVSIMMPGSSQHSSKQSSNYKRAAISSFFRNVMISTTTSFVSFKTDSSMLQSYTISGQAKNCALRLCTSLRFNPQAPIAQERQRICRYLMEQITSIATTLPVHTVVPYHNIPRRQYPKNTLARMEAVQP